MESSDEILQSSQSQIREDEEKRQDCLGNRISTGVQPSKDSEFDLEVQENPIVDKMIDYECDFIVILPRAEVDRVVEWIEISRGRMPIRAKGRMVDSQTDRTRVSRSV